MNMEQFNLGYLLNKAARLAKWKLNNKLDELGLTSSQWAVLKDIYDCEEKGSDDCAITPASIAKRLHYDRPTISGIIDRLSRQNLVLRGINPEDRRSQVIKLTDKSRDLIPQMEELSNRTIDQALNGFEQSEINQLRNFLTRIINNFN